MFALRRISLFAFTVLLTVGAAAQMKSSPADAGNEACSRCHSEIYQSYSKTVMASASGVATDGLIAGEFDHKPSGVLYRVYQQDNHAWMSYERNKENDVHGQREFLYFLGSGVKGRTYLFSVQGFLFESPINWYSQEKR